MKNILKELQRKDHPHVLGVLDIFKSIGPGLLVTVGLIDPGNWASNFAAGSEYGYALLWVVTLSTIMFIALQHNVAHLGIMTGPCFNEAAAKYAPKWIGHPIILSVILASISTSLAGILGGAIALQMLFGISIPTGSALTTVAVLIMLFMNSYKKMERAIIGFVSMIDLSFVYELFLVDTHWPAATEEAFAPAAPQGSLLIIMSVLGAIVMPYNLFLHPEIAQSREIYLEGDERIRHMLKYEFVDTLFSMIVGWVINSAMILLAASAFFSHGQHVDELSQAQAVLQPLLGNNAVNIFAIALLLAGISSTVTSGMAAGSIFSGLFGESYNAKDTYSIAGVVPSLGIALLMIFFIGDPFKGLIISQMFLSVQPPFIAFLRVGLTSSECATGKHANNKLNMVSLYSLAGIVTLLDIWLLIESIS